MSIDWSPSFFFLTGNFMFLYKCVVWELCWYIWMFVPRQSVVFFLKPYLYIYIYSLIFFSIYSFLLPVKKMTGYIYKERLPYTIYSYYIQRKRDPDNPSKNIFKKMAAIENEEIYECSIWWIEELYVMWKIPSFYILLSVG